MEKILLFLSGLFLANGIPHFIHGISGENFHNPLIHRWVSKIPSPVFNVLWGLLFFGLSIFILSFMKAFHFGFNWNTYALGGGFVFASIGLSIFFKAAGARSGWR